MAGEHGTNEFGLGLCCNEPKEIYWAVLELT